ncbi:uncharacterized protein BDR25DRAFT_89111 [Lindgomyces ingoldianus]|uniref:Uncharacterized protein n=1 Tax=Lindgomyces ingoldianus TaxID=673940 RepID=A0ACB6R9K3_9PLEO|nr:uncharacterized protein BDR25DRAFT_89111 [Lindgomyces ingoldianus]KAF2475861.1 hypothetical protein BDR25DRAFT_89111 [Lindgomyces ingoldianus]
MTTPKSQPTITLYRGWDSPGKYVWSPFVTKLEFRLRTSHLPYSCAAGSTASGPTGKIPYISLSTPGRPTEFLGDSSLIMKRLMELNLLHDVNVKLELQGGMKGVDLAIRALMEDKLYFYHTHERWIMNYYTMRDHVLGSIPYPVRVVIGLLAYRRSVRKLHDQGTGRFSNTEIRGFIKEVWEGINGLLVESRRKMMEKYGQRDSEGGDCFWILGGSEPTEADASVFGFVVSVLVCDAGPESKKLVRGFPVVVEYAERLHRRWFPDYEMWD